MNNKYLKSILLIGFASLSLTSCGGTFKSNTTSNNNNNKGDAITHTVTFSYNGDTTIVPKQTVVHGELATDPFMTRIGSGEPYTISWEYHIPGVWYDESNPDTPIDYYSDWWKFEVYPVMKDITLYAMLYD